MLFLKMNPTLFVTSEGFAIEMTISIFADGQISRHHGRL